MSQRGPIPEAPLDMAKRSGPAMFSLNENTQSHEAGAGKGKKVNSYNIIFMAMITSSILVIVSMRLLNRPIATLEASETISYDRPDIDPRRQAQQERMLASLQNTQTNLNVDPKTLGYTPMLTRERKVDPVAAAAPAPKAMDPAEKARLELASKRKTEFEKLELSGTTLGRVPVARINGELFKIGDKVGDLFTIKTITQRTVELTHQDMTFTLEQHEKGKDGKQGKSSIKRLPPQ